MRKGKWWLAVAVGALAVALGASMAMATELDEGQYSLTLPGVGDVLVFDVGEADGKVTVEEDTVLTVLVSGYVIDDDEPDKASWKDETGIPVLEVEAKTDKVEGDWNGDYATLTLPAPNAGTITVYKNGDPVTTTGAWTAIGIGDDWYAFNSTDPETATKFFNVEFNDDGFEFKAVSEIPENLQKDIDEEKNEAAEDAAEKAAEEAEEEEEKDDD